MTDAKFSHILDNTVEIETPEHFEYLSTKFGKKTVNMLLLDTIASNFNREKRPSIPIEIPSFFGLSDDFVGQFFDQLSTLWDAGASRDDILGYIKCQAGDASKVVSDVHALCEKKFGKDAVIMIRSTGNEDEANVPNPGGNDSESYVSITPKSLSLAIINVLSSYFSEKSFLQRQALGDHSVLQLPKLSLLLQVQIVTDTITFQLPTSC